jgi:cupin 2 domain-containing protein
VEIKNLFACISGSLPEEIVESLLETESFRVERIVSAGQATPAGEWFDQETDEWVLLLRGSAGLRFADESGIRVMRPGDSLRIPAHLRHRSSGPNTAPKRSGWPCATAAGKRAGPKAVDADGEPTLFGRQVTLLISS